ncbi:flagellar hook-length control protein FliK [Leeia oryzae]|uniref:flagellar hook-length control protein FliK n=1 Tax=Leeia oryzae TaxID=356662 RepID=UPI0003A22E3C|nr:flagellar hook-length control protein FliK [Leeia oryzae]
MLGNDMVSSLQSLVKTYNPPLIDISDTSLETSQFVPGEKVQAHVLAYLPNGRFQVSIKDQILDLNLPRNTQPGEQLDMEVVESKGKLVLTFAQNAAQAAAQATPASTATSSQQVNLSEPGKLINALLNQNQADGAPEGVSGKPIAPQLIGDHLDTLDTGHLSSQLQARLENSGLFYESHQKAWVSGERSLQSLKQEPQAEIGKALTLQKSPQDATPELKPAMPDMASLTNDANKLTDSAQQLQNLMRQQLHVLDERQLVWQGQVWPKQDMEWLVKDEGRHAQADQEEDRSWFSQLKLSLPQLGNLTVGVRLTGNQVSVQFSSQNEATVSQLNEAKQKLNAQMESAGLHLQQASVFRS